MTLTEATKILEEKLNSDYPKHTTKNIKWEGGNFKITKITHPGGMIIVTFSGLTGITIFDSVCNYKNGKWKNY